MYSRDIGRGNSREGGRRLEEALVVHGRAAAAEEAHVLLRRTGVCTARRLTAEV